MKHLLPTVLTLTLLAACGASATHTARAPQQDATNEQADAVASESAQEETREPEAQPEPSTPLACAERSATNCVVGSGCVAGGGRTCREAANDCERVAPATTNYGPTGGSPQFYGSYGRVTFVSGDPCASTDAACAYDFRMGLCEPFTPVAVCPETMAEATTLQISCMHPNQPALRCHYADHGGTTFECLRPMRHSGGMVPPPGSLDVPASWRGSRDHDDRGCPTSSTAFAERCRAPRALECAGGDSMYQCVRRRWRVTGQLPGRP